MTSHSVTENEWIVLKDGTRLAARIWMPLDAPPAGVPAVLEYLPYRKGDGTSMRDEATYPGFADAGIAGIRVDIRGSGESDGVIDGEYTPREFSDALEVIDWIVAQPWSNGSVGMMGISWGGFNSLQIAALKHPALKAVISIASTVDRYNDDIHHKNGCLLSANLSWAAYMLAYQSRAPDPAIVGERWREMWLERLEGEPFFLEEWLRHQRRDAFWRHGSICEDFEGFPVPALVIAGWADGYRNTPLKAVEGLGTKAKALIGPWVHKYPHFAWPKPRTDFLGEAIAWWNRWLKGEANGAEAGPQVRAFILDGPKPALRREVEPGRWVAMETWQAPKVHVLHGQPGRRLGPQPAPTGEALFLRSPEDTGVMAGEWFTLKPDAEMAGDQRLDDAGSLTFETDPLKAPLELLGFPTLKLSLTPEAASGNLVARLVDVHPTGEATRISFGVLNLSHRGGNAEPVALVPGEAVEIALTLDACGYRLAPGHVLRLSVSTAYWPMVLPGPISSGVTIDSGSVRLVLPLLPSTAETIEIPEPADPNPLPTYIEHAPAVSRRSVERDLMAGVTRYRLLEDTGLYEHPDTGLSTRQVREETWTIAPDDPLSMVGETRWSTEMQRADGWTVTTRTLASLSCTATDFHISAEARAYEGEREVHVKTWDTAIPRDFS
ncbi:MULTISPECIES: CocE/NonD family hydrolase [unclassified Aureimonas]|uniref:CocE/NonD family hydrolase n=1 Tax=unclassified Aureimonas TaxID=2615206 RepID=UPI0006F66B2A|nr:MULTISPECIES: CocE/NonD family hydrolase [unclassified Aureimonas]KQT64092.1 peptidase [Aureimonas sp. Leaf427]KQT81282.1 peptidase [Aureimonas sp. Leaf460]